MEMALIGLLGVVIGLFIREYLRRRSRIETYSSRVFDKRLEIYEAFARKLSESLSVASDIFENPDYSKDERHEIWSAVVLDLAEYADMNSLYLNEDIAVHCMATIIGAGAEDIYYIKDEKEKERQEREFNQRLRNGIEMIKKETGLQEIDKLFTSMTKAKHKSDIISYANEVRKKVRKRQRKGDKSV